MTKKINIEIVRLCLTGCGLGNLSVKLDEECYEIEGHPAILIDEWVDILPVPMTVQPKGITKLPPKEIIGYQIQIAHHYPGVRYYPDGSGEPPSTDIEDVGDPYPDIYSAIEAVACIIVKNSISQVAENISLDELYQEEQEYWKEMEADQKAGKIPS